MKGVSIVLCCYNSADRIEQTLFHLSKQIYHSFELELILVDNASLDQTKDIAIKLWHSFNNPFPLRLIEEKRQGLSFARMCGVKNASFELIIFCDDDNWLYSDYVYNAYHLMNNQDIIGAAGGFGEAISRVPLPDWFEQYKGGYAIGDASISSGFLSDGQLLTGAGLVFRRNLFLKVFENAESLLVDRSGNTLSSGGDSEICLRFLLYGYKLYYDASLKFKHFLPAGRLTEEYRSKLFASFKQMAPVIDFYLAMLQVKRLNYFARLVKLVIILLKLPFTSLRLIRRWDLRRDLMQLFIITGLSMIPIPENWVAIRTKFLN
jgi:glycosyltransferase involved in cell wall biosynthesis